MHERLPGTGRLQAVTGYTVALALCLGVLTAQLKLWRADLSVPFAYTCDGLSHGVWVRTVVEHGWYLHNDRLGMPTGLDMHDYPMSDGLHFLLLKLLGLVVRDFALTFNLFFLLTFPLTTGVALFVLRRFGLGRGPGILASLLYTFLPYHLFRGPHHLFLASYYLVPLAVLVVLRVFLDELPWFGRSGAARGEEPKPSRWRFIGAVLSCFLVASAGVYFAFFACFFLLVAGLASCLRLRRVYPLFLAGTLVGVVAAGVVVNVAPTLLYHWEHGPNPEAVVRDPGVAELHGLKVVQLLLPVYEHRVPALAALQARYRWQAPLVGENDWSSLGLTASVGFLFLLGRFLYRAPGPAAPSVPEGLGILNLAAVLLATLGGFGSFFAFVVSPWIRGYNRMSVYIAFFGLFVVALGLDRLGRRCTTLRRRVVFHAGVGLLLAGGIFDQASRYVNEMYASRAEEYRHDAEFVRAVEAAVPEHTMIFQLPCTVFPENGRLHDLLEYDHFRPYFHSRTLRWSYGAMKGRAGDAWQRRVVGRPVEEMVHALVVAGFGGVYLDRAGYADRGAEIEARLTHLLGRGPLTSRNGRMLFFDLAAHARQVREGYSDESWEEEREALLHPLLFAWCGGFSYPEKSAAGEWRWCSSRGELHLTNPSARDKRVALSLSFWAPHERPAALHVRSSLFSAEVQVSTRAVTLERTVTIPPGRHVIRFACAGKKVRAPGETRELVFMLKNFRATEL